MYRKEVNMQSPLRILEASIHGGLGPGNLGVVMARAGVGKTACLVQIALDDLMREKQVLHIALGGQHVEHVQSWYDALFDDMANSTNLANRAKVATAVSKGRIIHAVTEDQLSPAELDRVLALYGEHLSFAPQAIILDGYDWVDNVPVASANIGALKAIAQRIGAELWISAQTHREQTGAHPMEIPPPCAAYVDLLDVAILLEPKADHVTVRLLKDHDADAPKDTTLELQCDTMRLVDVGQEAIATQLPATTCTLLSGGARGTEAAFGACAEAWGLKEVHFSFDGHKIDRTRGVVVLTEADLRQGAVTTAYVQAQMHRSYPQTPLFEKLLQSIWHQVNTARQVFVVGVINEDNTVKGGTGWAAELGKHLHKEVLIYEQEQRGWYRWTGSEWSAVDAPCIRSRRFTGAGTRFLSDDGRAAIEALFERSFGPAPTAV